MSTTRIALKPAEILKLLYDFYLEVITQIKSDEKWHRGSSTKEAWIKDQAKIILKESFFKDFNAFTNEELVEFFCLKPTADAKNNINGLWLIVWFFYESKMIYDCDDLYSKLPKKLIELPEELFAALEFNAFGNGIELTHLTVLEMLAESFLLRDYKLSIFSRFSTWPTDKIKELCFDAHQVCQRDSTAVCIEGGLFVSLADKLPLGCRDNILGDFLRLFSLVPAYTDNNFHNSILLKTKYNSEHRYGHLAEGLSFLLVVNSLKVCAKKSLPFNELDKKLSANCERLPTLSGENLFIFADFIRSLNTSEETLTAEIEQLQKIKRDHKIDLDIYYQSQMRLANHFFTKKQVSLGDRLYSLKTALAYAIKARLAGDDQDNQFILRIAEAYVCADPTNLNSNIYGISLDLSEFDWIIKMIHKMFLVGQQPRDEALTDGINTITIELTRQRNVVAAVRGHLVSETSKKVELGAELNRLTRENADLKERVKLLEQQVEALIKASSMKVNADGVIYTPKLF